MAATDSATTAQALLALYGALDQAVTGTGDRAVESTVERYLPGGTGANAGWYDELLGFLAGNSPRQAAASPGAPSLDRALSVLRGGDEPRIGAAESPLTPVQLSRTVYAIGALSHLPTYYPPDRWDGPFAQTLALAGPTGGEDLLHLLRREFDDRADWSRTMQLALSEALVNDAVAAVPQCQAKPRWVGGHLCVVLTTEFTSGDVSLNQLKNVIDPLNWHNCLPFFCLMEKEPVRPDGWSRVLEHVSTTCSIPGTPQLVTPLKYWKGPRVGENITPPTAWVDYALDDDPAPGESGDGRMVVDEGFIRMTSTGDDPAGAGVRVRTRKVAGFRNLAWFPAAVFACVMGYADQGVEMLLGGVAKRPKGGSKKWTDWEPSTPPDDSGQSVAGEETDVGRRAVTVAVEMLDECIGDMSEKSAALAAKWSAGAAPIDASMQFAADLAVRLATDPWRYLDRLRSPGSKG